MEALVPRPANTSGLRLNPITVRPEYLAEWNETCSDFKLLTYNGEVVGDSLYRVGGLGTDQIQGLPYFILLKYIESVYSKEIIEQSRSKDKTGKHLAGHWCILDQYGKERVVFKKLESPYLVKDSLLYSLDGTYYNIETGLRYGKISSGGAMKTAEYIFIDTKYDKEAIGQGVQKIHKKTGDWELFPV